MNESKWSSRNLIFIVIILSGWFTNFKVVKRQESNEIEIFLLKILFLLDFHNFQVNDQPFKWGASEVEQWSQETSNPWLEWWRDLQHLQFLLLFLLQGIIWKADCGRAWLKGSLKIFSKYSIIFTFLRSGFTTALKNRDSALSIQRRKSFLERVY